MGPSTLAAWALLISRALIERGVHAEPLFRRAGMPPERLHDPNARYPGAAIQRLWQLGAEATQDPCFGLEVGRLWHPTTFHALGYVALASASLREALSYLVRYSRIVSSGAVLELVDEGDESILVLANGAAAAQGAMPWMRIAVHAGLAAIATLCREACGGAVPLQRVTLTFEAGACGPRLKSFFRCPVIFECKDNAIVIRRDLMDAPLPTSNRELLRINHQLLADQLAALSSNQLSMRVAAHVARLLPSGEIDQTLVARALNMSRRSLQRKLHEEGLSFRQVVDETRRDLAQQYFKDATLSAAEVAYLLGFAEPSSLSRAMRRWRTSAADPGN